MNTTFSKTFASFKHRNYQLFFGGQLVSVAGTWMQVIAQGWLVYQLTHSDFALGLIGFASAIPVLLITPIAGIVVDRFPKRSLLVATQTAAMLLAFILAALSFTGAVQLWHLLLLAAGLGAVNAFDAPARQAFVVEMVGREDLSNAIALNSVLFNGARVIGPAIGGLLLSAFGPSWCFLINGISFLAVIAGLLLMQVPPHQPFLTRGSSLKQLAQGFEYSLAHKDVLALLLLAAIFSMFGSAYSAVLPAFVDENLHAGATGYGVINAVTGLGAVVAGTTLAGLGEAGKRVRLLFGANVFYTAILLLFAYNHWYALSLVLVFFLGSGFMLQFTLMNTMLQTRVTDEVRGRVMSIYTLCIFGLSPFGNLAIGSASEAWGLSLSIGLSAGIALFLALIVMTGLPELRKTIEINNSSPETG